MFGAKSLNPKQSEMNTPTTIYKFAEFTFNPAKRKLFRDDEEILLINRDFETLRFLIENRPQPLSKDRIMKSVWGDTVVDENSIEKAIASLRKLLRDSSLNSRFIKTVTKKGYAFIHDVDETTGNTPEPIFKEQFVKQSFSSHFAYIFTCSLLYGLLFWIALLLEVAYQFDRFGATALWLGFPIILWITATSFVGMTLTKNLIRQKKRGAFFTGLAFFVGGAILLCLAASYFLPNEAITVARNIQTQPAFAAYFKNSIYFLSLGIVFILIPFYFVCLRQNFVPNPDVKSSFFWSKGEIYFRPAYLFGLLLTAFILSVFSSFYLSDNLQPGQYHSLFIILLILRLLIYFSLGSICLFWYSSQKLSG